MYKNKIEKLEAHRSIASMGSFVRVTGTVKMVKIKNTRYNSKFISLRIQSIEYGKPILWTGIIFSDYSDVFERAKTLCKNDYIEIAGGISRTVAAPAKESITLVIVVHVQQLRVIKQVAEELFQDEI